MTLTVVQIINGIIEREQGYVNNPNDLGGVTNWGITERVARAWGYKGDMKSLPHDTAFEIYFDQYYNTPQFNQVLLRSYRLGIAMTDAGVLCGTSTVSKWLQIILNVLNGQQKLYKDMIVDGSIGLTTLSALKAFLDTRGKDGEIVLVRAFYSMLGSHFIESSISRPQNEDFTYGWFLKRMDII